MVTALAPTAEMRASRRALEGMPGTQRLGDWAWYDAAQAWALHYRLVADTPADSPVPAATDWYIVVDAAYPWGTITFYPAKRHGLTATFAHQMYNAPGDDDVPWRTGNVCLSADAHALGRHGYDHEPHDTDERLRWHVRRSLDWLAAAAHGALTLSGEPFEAPHFPGAATSGTTVAYTEGPSSFVRWQTVVERSGIVEFADVPGNATVRVVKHFDGPGTSARPPSLHLNAARRRRVLDPRWGQALEAVQAERVGMWVRLPAPPTLSPWQAAATWGELREVCRIQDIDIDGEMQAVVVALRDGYKHIMLVGFPIPEHWGGPDVQMHWQALLLPYLSWGKRTADGFHPGHEPGYRRRDRLDILADATPIEWLKSENWSARQISTRGQLPRDLRTQTVAIIGAGAIGSAVAELLVRGGVAALTIVDSDVVEAGNLVRHTLLLGDVGTSKARTLAKRLQWAAPHVTVSAVDARFPRLTAADSERLRGCDLIVDCTAQDEVAYHMGRFDWGGPKHFVSISLGLFARRLYYFSAHGERFPHDVFMAAVAPWLQDERGRYANEELPREGLGCWHPVFPARTDDVWLLATVAVKRIASTVAAPSSDGLVVFEQCEDDSAFSGVRIAEEDPHA